MLTIADIRDLSITFGIMAVVCICWARRRDYNKFLQDEEQRRKNENTNNNKLYSNLIDNLMKTEKETIDDKTN